jgi:hypothetical protein
VISAKRKETLPRKVDALAGRRKQVVEPGMDVAIPRTKARRASGRASRKPEATTVEALAVVEAEMTVEASQIVEEATIAEVPVAPAPPAPPAPRQTRPGVVTIVSQLISTLLRWAGAGR